MPRHTLPTLVHASLGVTAVTAPLPLVSVLVTGYGLPVALVPIGAALMAIGGTCVETISGNRAAIPPRLPAHTETMSAHEIPLLREVA